MVAGDVWAGCAQQGQCSPKEQPGEDGGAGGRGWSPGAGREAGARRPSRRQPSCGGGGCSVLSVWSPATTCGLRTQVPWAAPEGAADHRAWSRACSTVTGTPGAWPTWRTIRHLRGAPWSGGGVAGAGARRLAPRRIIFIVSARRTVACVRPSPPGPRRGAGQWSRWQMRWQRNGSTEVRAGVVVCVCVCVGAPGCVSREIKFHRRDGCR